MQQLLSHISVYHRLSIEAENALQDCFTEITLNKNEFLLTQGNVCRHLYFLKKGGLRGFYNLDGKEITHWFGFEKDFVTSLTGRVLSEWRRGSTNSLRRWQFSVHISHPNIFSQFDGLHLCKHYRKTACGNYCKKIIMC